MFSMRRFKVEEIELHHQGLRPGAAPLTFAHITDLHLREWGPEHELLIETINGRDVDFVFLTGDLVTVRPASARCAGRLMGKLRSRHGLFASRGNWEVAFGPPLHRLTSQVQEWGATLLTNESLTLATDAGRVRVCGVDDLSRGWPDFSAALDATGERADLTVLLSHCPLAATLLPPGHGVDLILSGHTHGGQIRIPFLWRSLLPACHGDFSDGLYELDALRLYVNRGFGSVGIVPLRFNCPAEVAIFRILPPAQEGLSALSKGEHENADG